MMLPRARNSLKPFNIGISFPQSVSHKLIGAQEKASPVKLALREFAVFIRPDPQCRVRVTVCTKAAPATALADAAGSAIRTTRSFVAP
jgi:hypothetical protein